MTETAAGDLEILAPPTDGVSCMRFSHTGNKQHLLVASWDAALRLYEGVKMRTKIDLDTALLACCFGGSDNEAFAGGLDGAVKQIDLNAKRMQATVGTHATGTAVRMIDYAKEFGLCISGGWDGAIKVWDVRNGQNAKIQEAKHDGKVFGMDVRSHLVVVGTSTREIAVYDLRNFAQPICKRESPLKYQTRCVKIFPNLEGYAIGSIEGRVALEYFQDSPTEKKSYAFKCHREKIGDELFIYPVNAMAFHPTYGTFATGGCDGVVNMWDGDHKKRIHQFQKCPTSVAALDFNHDGSMLAIASSYTFEQGEKDHPSDQIFLHHVQPSEVRPKTKSNQ